MFNFQSGPGSTPANPLRLLFIWLAQLPPFVMLLMILGCSTIVTYLHMNLRDTATTAITHFASPDDHIPLSLSIVVIVSLLFLQILTLQRQTMTWRTKIQKIHTEGAKLQFLNTPTTMEIPVASPDAWAAIKRNLQGEIIKGCDTRRTHWEIVGLDESRRQLRLALRYTNDPLGRKPYQVSARKLTCSMKVTSLGGRKTQVDLLFSSKFPMNYRTVRELIDRTKTAISRIAIQPEPEESPRNYYS